MWEALRAWLLRTEGTSQSRARLEGRRVNGTGSELARPPSLLGLQGAGEPWDNLWVPDYTNKPTFLGVDITYFLYTVDP